MQAALEKVEGVKSVTVTRPDSASVTGSATAETLIAAVNGIAGGKYKATAH